MVTLRPMGKDHEFEVWCEPPSIYLDHWALRRLSENPTLGERFLAAFKKRGTVMFSLMNVVEIARDPAPKRAQEIRDFLDKIGPYWTPMSIDALRIMDAEDSGKTPDGADPCVSAKFLTDKKFAAALIAGPVSLAHVVDLTRGQNGDDIRNDTDCDTAGLRRSIQDSREAHAKDPKVLDKKYPDLKFDPAKPMRPIYYGLARLTITDSFKLDGPNGDNHARDLYHAVASVRCADLVTLDAHWVAQVRKLNLPSDFVHVYSESDFENFLMDLESGPKTR